MNLGKRQHADVIINSPRPYGRGIDDFGQLPALLLQGELHPPINDGRNIMY